MLIQFDGGPLDGVSFEHRQGVDKVLLITDGDNLIRYECGFQDTAGSHSVCHLQESPLPAEFDAEAADSMRRSGSLI